MKVICQWCLWSVTIEYSFNRASKELVEDDKMFKCCSSFLNPHRSTFDDFIGKYDKLQSELVISNNCNSSLVNWIISLKKPLEQCSVYKERNAGDKSCSSFNKHIDLEEKNCETLSLTSTEAGGS